MTGTLVASEQGFVPIDQVQAGDAVLALDLASGAVFAQKATKVIRAHADELLELDFGDEVIRCTPAHRFYTGRWVAARYLGSGDRVLRSDGRWQELKDVERKAEPQPVFNLEVEGLRNYLVGRSGLLVHNAKDENGDGKDGPAEVKPPRRRNQRPYAPRRGRRKGS